MWVIISLLLPSDHFMISQQDKSRILMASDIVEVIEDHVPLKKFGQNFKGLCPFHNEKTPSFTVSPAKQIFHCFGCKESGDVIGFLMKHEHLSYPDALKSLGRRYNIDVQERELTQEELLEKNKSESLAVIMQMASKWFRNSLLTSEKGKAIGQSYIKERDINEKSSEDFFIGYCPDEPFAFGSDAIDRQYSKELLLEAGLIRENVKGAYDVYRGRLIFPIKDLGGKVIAFGARALKTGQQPKYINSPESLIYNKSRILYGLHHARKAISKKDNVYIVEGYTDVIAMHQAGIENTVATCGTALTEDHAIRLKHLTKNITVIFDGDVAGQKAAHRSINLILKAGLNPWVITLPEGEDPDSFTRSLSIDDLLVYLESNRQGFLDFLFDAHIKQVNDPLKRSQASKIIIESVSHISDHVKRAFYIQSLSTSLGIDEKTIVKEINRIRLKSTYQRPHEREVMEKEVIPQDQVSLNPVDIRESLEQEKDILRVLLFYGENEFEYTGENEEGEEISAKCSFADFIFNELENNQITFSHQPFEDLYRQIKSRYFTTRQIPLKEIIHSENLKTGALAAQILSAEVNISENWESMFDIVVAKEDERPERLLETAINRLKIKTVLKTRKALSEQLSNTFDNEEQLKILRRIQRLDQIKKDLSEYFGTTVY